ncbi:MAG: hypothetical protein JSS72_00190 [Armatimonadetes bacterium]|nr:hypothetical protein [Armatimonadota bacterium]
MPSESSSSSPAACRKRQTALLVRLVISMLLPTLLLIGLASASQDTPGVGPKIVAGDEVVVDVVVLRSTGREVANTKRRGLPLTLVVGVTKQDYGLSELLLGMQKRSRKIAHREVGGIDQTVQLDVVKVIHAGEEARVEPGR